MRRMSEPPIPQERDNPQDDRERRDHTRVDSQRLFERTGSTASENRRYVNTAERTSQMNAIRVKKDDLLAKLRANRENHKAVFDKAAEGYRAKVVSVLEERIADARQGKLPTLIFNLPMPMNQTAQYDRAIGMLEMTIEDTIELEEHDYQQYVMDEWGWSAATTATNSFYIAAK